jgi:mannitol/fructose-specific phosphotransferase system IIA component (Ntr-type)
MMGTMPMIFAIGLAVVGLVWYLLYARDRAEHAVALMKVLERIAEQVLSRESAGPVLDRELREIMKEKGLREDDPFVQVINRAKTIDLSGNEEWDDLMHAAVEHFTAEYPDKKEEIRTGLFEASRKGNTPAAQGIALPHVLIDGVARYEVLLVRSKNALHFPGVGEPVHAVFVLMGCKPDPQQHLRMLAALARRVEETDFMERWLAAPDGESLKQLILET